MKKQFTLLALGIVATTFTANAQTKIKDGTVLSAPLPDANAILELESNNKGLLLPRVNLDSTGLAAPLTAHVAGMSVYNTATATDVTPGYYYNDGAKWVRIANDGNFWQLTGNAGTTAGTNFLGTTDTQSLVLKVNNLNSGRISYYAGGSNPTGSGDGQTSFGYRAAAANTGTGTTAFGNAVLINNSGAGNTGVGFSALTSNSTGANNSALGSSALSSNSTGSNNVAIGDRSLQNIGAGSRNTGVGSRAAFQATGSDNTVVGYNAGTSLSTGNNNTLIGSLSNVTGVLNNATAIGYNAIVGASNSLVLGGTGANAVNVGVGTTTPSNTLHVVATENPARLEGLQAGAATDAIVTVNAAGVLRTIPSNNLQDIKTVVGVPGAVGANALGRRVSTDDGFQAPINNHRRYWRTGASITLPPGRWAVNVNMLLSNRPPMDPITNTANNSSFWVRSTFTPDSAPDRIITKTDAAAYIDGSHLISGNIVGPSPYGLVKGTVIINNTSATPVTYYYTVGDVWCSGGVEDARYFGNFQWDEDSIIAYKLD